MENSPLVLVVDDEPGVLRLVELELLVQGFRVITAVDGEDALRRIADVTPDIAILDVVMPRMSGLELMSHLKASLGLPVILLTAKTSAQDRFRGLELGADDYIEKPFMPEDLSERVRALVRRKETGQPEVISYAGLEIDLKRRLVTRDGKLVTLSRTEWLLLQHLATSPGRVMPAAEILTAVWGAEYADDVHFLRAWVGRLRNRLEEDPANPRLIRSEGGDRYRFGPPEAGESA